VIKAYLVYLTSDIVTITIAKIVSLYN